MDETGYRVKECDALAFCLCLIRINKPFQSSSRVKEMDAADSAAQIQLSGPI